MTTHTHPCPECRDTGSINLGDGDLYHCPACQPYQRIVRCVGDSVEIEDVRVHRAARVEDS